MKLQVRSLGGDPPPRTVQPNKLLAALPPEECDRILPALRTVPLRYKQVLHRHGEPVRYVYFPASGVTSITTLMRDGRTVEMATVGNEGMVGIWPVLSASRTAGDATVQVPGGSAQMMAIEAFRLELERRAHLYQVVTRYINVFLVVTMQSTACNGLHTVEQRCCRWLLLAHDRVARDEFRLTHETLSVMLGVRRSSVTEVMRDLKSDRVVEYSAGKILILDRPGLERRACECYGVIRTQFAQLID
jgi:CRP-like cAMP-binding protein